MGQRQPCWAHFRLIYSIFSRLIQISNWTDTICNPWPGRLKMWSEHPVDGVSLYSGDVFLRSNDRQQKWYLAIHLIALQWIPWFGKFVSNRNASNITMMFPSSPLKPLWAKAGGGFDQGVNAFVTGGWVPESRTSAQHRWGDGSCPGKSGMTSMYKCIHICIYVYTYVYMYTHMYLFIYNIRDTYIFN